MPDVLMPQMGESIAEGTIVRWLKKVGERVDRDEPLFEISTDKVDAEIPSPAAGVLAEIRAKDGDTVPVNEIVAVISEEAAQATAPRPAASVDGLPASAGAEGGATADSLDERRPRSSSLVRRIAAEHGVEVSQVPGTGLGGRVTKQDILAYVAPSPAAGAARVPTSPTAVPAAPGIPASWGVVPGEHDEVVAMTPMRRRIAEHMIASRRTSAHVHTVFEVDFSSVEAIRHAHKAEFERAGARLTYLPFVVKAVVGGLRQVPIVNASVDGEAITYHKAINIGIAVALDWGLIVPVLERADEMNVLGLSRAMADLAGRARAKQLKPREVQGATFTITNPGVFGALFGTPIISQPQVAILGVGAVQKRVVVEGDAIAIRPMAYLSLGYDHRVIDGAVADAFMSIVKKQIETFDAAAL